MNLNFTIMKGKIYQNYLKWLQNQLLFLAYILFVIGVLGVFYFIILVFH